jgi:hypothetical protein
VAGFIDLPRLGVGGIRHPIGLGSLLMTRTTLGGGLSLRRTIPMTPFTLYRGLDELSRVVVSRLYRGRPDGPGGPQSRLIVAEFDPHSCTVSCTVVLAVVRAVNGAAMV